MAGRRVSYNEPGDYWVCDDCRMAEYADAPRDMSPVGWIHTQMGEDLCPRCQDQRYNQG